jgi:hypothetical protein
MSDTGNVPLAENHPFHRRIQKKTNQWLPTEGDNVRVINPARTTYGKDGVVVSSTGTAPYISVLVNHINDPGYLYEPNELELLR